MAHAATSLPATYQKLQGQIISPNFREATAIVTLPLPVPAAKEILVKTHWVGVNASDLNLTNARVRFPVTYMFVHPSPSRSSFALVIQSVLRP